MNSRAFANTLHASVFASFAVIAAVGLSSPAAAQDIRFSHVPSGTEVRVRSNQTIDVNQSDQRIYTGTVMEDVWGDDGRVAIPEGSQVEMRIAVRPDNDLVLHADGIMVNGRRYDVETSPSWFSASRDENVFGAIAGALSGGAIHGSAVRVSRGTVVSFELERPLNVAQPARDFDRDRFRGDDRDRPRGEEQGR